MGPDTEVQQVLGRSHTVRRLSAAAGRAARAQPPAADVHPLALVRPCRLSDRFGEHAQFDKQRALQLLRAHLHELPAQSLQVRGGRGRAIKPTRLACSRRAGVRACGQLPAYASTSVCARLRCVRRVYCCTVHCATSPAWQALHPSILPPLCCPQYEFQHRVLAFLYAAARSPLNAHYSAGPLVDSLEAKAGRGSLRYPCCEVPNVLVCWDRHRGSQGDCPNPPCMVTGHGVTTLAVLPTRLPLLRSRRLQARTAVVGPPTYLSDASSDADSWIEELGAYSPSSRLSDWSDVAVQEGGEDGMASASAEVAPAAHERAAGAAAAAAGASSPPGRLSPSPDAALARLFPDASRQAPRRATPYTRTSLSVWLASKASGGQPARLLQPALCFHEGELLQQVGGRGGAGSRRTSTVDVAASCAPPACRGAAPACCSAEVRGCQCPRPAPPHPSALPTLGVASKQRASSFPLPADGAHAARSGQPLACCQARPCARRPLLPSPELAIGPSRCLQTVHMLQGVSAPGPAFQLDPVRGAYSPCPGVHRASSSQGSARALLARFCSTASALRRVRAFCAAAGGRGSSSGEAEPDQARLLRLPSVVAFAAAVGEQLQVAERQLLVLQSALDAGALLSLQQLQQRTACLAEQAALLDGLVRRCSAWRGSAADTAASLLTALYQALQLQLLQARSQGATRRRGVGEAAGDSPRLPALQRSLLRLLAAPL